MIENAGESVILVCYVVHCRRMWEYSANTQH